MSQAKSKIINRIFLVATLWFIAMQAFANPPYQIVETITSVNKQTKLGLFESLVQVGPNKLNRFTLHRLVKLNHVFKPQKGRHSKGAVILLPGSAANFDSFLLGNEGESLAEQLALAGYEVYGYSYRTQGLTTAKHSPEQLAVIKQWDMQTYLEDINFIRRQVRKYHRKDPVIAGYSLGGMLAIAAVNAQPDKYAGIAILEAALHYSPPLSVQFAEYAAMLDFAWQNGVYFDAEQYPLLRSVVQLGHYYPHAQSPFENSVTNELFLQLLALTPTDPPQGAAPGYTYAAGDFVNGYYFLDMVKALDLANSFNDLESIALLRDYYGEFAGARKFSSNLNAFTQPIFSLQAGQGFGVYAEDTLALFGSTQVTRHVFPELGHLDVLAHQDMDTIIEPLLLWLDSEVNDFQ